MFSSSNEREERKKNDASSTVLKARRAERTNNNIFDEKWVRKSRGRKRNEGEKRKKKRPPTHTHIQLQWVLLSASLLHSDLDKKQKNNTMIGLIVLLLTFSPIVIGSDDDSINLLVRSSINSTIRRYCVDLATLPNGVTVNVTGFDWHIPYIASPAVNACNETDLKTSLPDSFAPHTLLILTEHQCKMTEHAWHVQDRYGEKISLMIFSKSKQYAL